MHSGLLLFVAPASVDGTGTGTRFGQCPGRLDVSNGSDDGNSSKADREQQIRNRWISYAKFGVEYELRGQTVDDENGGYEGERVVTLGLEPDGQLRVRGRDGRERKLIADYTF